VAFKAASERLQRAAGERLMAKRRANPLRAEEAPQRSPLAAGRDRT